jgi:hypothetical protein
MDTNPGSLESPTLRTMFYTGLVLAWTIGVTRQLGLERMLHICRQALCPTAQEPQDSERLIATTATAIARAAALLPVRAQCLEQSLALCYCLRRESIPVSLRVGVRPYGFHAHAWVEYRGRPINENNEILRAVTPFPALVG